MKPSKAAKESLELTEEIMLLLAYRGPDVQGAVLADLVSLYFAGHHPDVREQSIELWLETMRQLIPASEKEMGDPWLQPLWRKHDHR